MSSRLMSSSNSLQEKKYETEKKILRLSNFYYIFCMEVVERSRFIVDQLFLRDNTNGDTKIDDVLLYIHGSVCPISYTIYTHMLSYLREYLMRARNECNEGEEADQDIPIDDSIVHAVCEILSVVCYGRDYSLEDGVYACIVKSIPSMIMKSVFASTKVSINLIGAKI